MELRCAFLNVVLFWQPCKSKNASSTTPPFTSGQPVPTGPSRSSQPLPPFPAHPLAHFPSSHFSSQALPLSPPPPKYHPSPRPLHPRPPPPGQAQFYAQPFHSPLPTPPMLSQLPLPPPSWVPAHHPSPDRDLSQSEPASGDPTEPQQPPQHIKQQPVSTSTSQPSIQSSTGQKSATQQQLSTDQHNLKTTDHTKPPDTDDSPTQQQSTTPAG